MISKSDLRLLALMLEKINRLLLIVTNYSREEIEQDFLLSDSIQFEFEKLYEDSARLSQEFNLFYKGKLHVDDLRAIRNRVAHDYESVSLRILIKTIKEDLPTIKQELETIINKQEVK